MFCIFVLPSRLMVTIKTNKMKQIFLIINNGNVLQAFEDKAEAISYKEVEEKVNGCKFDFVAVDLHTKKDSIRRRKESKQIFNNLTEGIRTDINF